MSYVLGVDAPRSITPVAASITSPAGVALNVPPVALLSLMLLFPLRRMFRHSRLLSVELIQSLAK
jgi:hypothetical protein